MATALAQTATSAPDAVTPPPGAPDTVSEAVKIDPAFALGKLESWIVGFQKLLPNIVVALVVLVIFCLIGWLLGRGFERWAKRRERDNLGDVLGSFLTWIVILFGTLLALTIVIPSLNPGDLLAGLGVGSVAIGFAFKDILQNWLAGLLLLIRQPFKVGDQIVVKGFEGKVEWIETRATIITTYDGRQVIIPNADVYSNAVTVNTAHEKRRSQYDVGIGYGDDIETARQVILTAIENLQGVEAEPKPEVLVWDLATSTVNLRVRWWTHSVRTDVVHTQARVLEAIKHALDAAGIDMPFDTQVLLFHDQTEETDGVRGRQREGWPRPADREPPRPARRGMDAREPRGETSTDG
ncbi:mechanosensitive ion channel family protein [Mangrovibrevibacter kandeliae]|uniref:mechanosensitive ion channel family protein n=1 Tax=Mangrovibrevibacter kandeliae TaxID=2968473 RepID=UPI002118EB5F|nr:mechanosensitive ion channel family protein [Aurantimonas sp. CSK15Z-1]MCQ8784144.1 mechanosensitive ion channel family protein [Aurantimonas sp. CSK15Z-1]